MENIEIQVFYINHKYILQNLQVLFLRHTLISLMSLRHDNFYIIVYFIWILFTAEDDHASMPAGLWILSAFLFFVIVEKLIAAVNEEASIIPEQQTDEISIENANKEKEADNNNCITMMSTEKNGFVKKCLKDTTKVTLIKSITEMQCCM